MKKALLVGRGNTPPGIFEPKNGLLDNELKRGTFLKFG
jgi:hypothetical protein